MVLFHYITPSHSTLISSTLFIKVFQLISVLTNEIKGLVLGDTNCGNLFINNGFTQTQQM